jgi:hypothetical protein
MVVKNGAGEGLLLTHRQGAARFYQEQNTEQWERLHFGTVDNVLKKLQWFVTFICDGRKKNCFEMIWQTCFVLDLYRASETCIIIK